jgi:hypothetical protein
MWRSRRAPQSAIVSRMLDDMGVPSSADALSLEERLLRLTLSFPVDCVLTEEPRVLGTALRAGAAGDPKRAREVLTAVGEFLGAQPREEGLREAPSN